MNYLRTKGIVIREVDTGEADKVVTVFSRDEGKLAGFAKGARRPKSRLAAGTQFLCYGDFVLYRGREMFSINSCDVLESFYGIRNDIEKLTYSAHMADIIGDVIQENQPSARILQLLLNSLHMLAKTDRQPELITRAFELRTLSLIGYAPHVSECIACGKQDTGRYSFSFMKCGLLCGACAAGDSSAVPLSPGAEKAVRHIVTSKTKDLFNFSLSQDVRDELGGITRRYLRDRLERDYGKLDFLKTLK